LSQESWLKSGPTPRTKEHWRKRGPMSKVERRKKREKPKKIEDVVENGELSLEKLTGCARKERVKDSKKWKNKKKREREELTTNWKEQE
jgi:hypothetical protein